MKTIAKSPVVKIEAQPSNNLLLVHYEGSVSVTEIAPGAQRVPAALAQLKSGFRLLVDLTDLCSMDIACAPFIENVMDLCQEKGVAEVVRVIPHPARDIGLQIMSHFHYGPAVRIATCETMGEAMSILSGRDGESQ